MRASYMSRKSIRGPNGMTGKRSELLRQVLGEKLGNKPNKSVLASETYEEMGYGSASSASQFIAHVASGYVYGTCGTPLNPTLQLYRLSVVLENLGLPEEDRLIKELRKIRGFEYPPVLNNDISLILEAR